MRGKVPMTKVFSDSKGITPAYAGKSFSGYGVSESIRDHPRLCGEKN